MQIRPPPRLTAFRALSASLALAAAAAHAETATPPPPWPAAAESPAPAATDPTRPLLLGATHVVLDSTTIVGLRGTVGAGAIVHQGNGTDSLDWLCYTLSGATPVQRLWLTSSELARGRIDGITAVDLPAGAAATAPCPELPPKFRPVRFEDGLWLGASVPELRKELGAPPHPGASFSTLFHGLNGNLDVVGSIVIEFHGARVATIHVAHSTQD